MAKMTKFYTYKNMNIGKESNSYLLIFLLKILTESLPEQMPIEPNLIKFDQNLQSKETPEKVLL